MIVQKNEQLGMISVPWQEYAALYTPAEALLYGTVFSSLHQPYTPTQCPQQAMQIPQAHNMQNMQGMQKKREAYK